MVQILDFHMRTQFLFHDHIDMVTIEFAKCKREVAERSSTGVSSHLNHHLHAFSSYDLSSWDLSLNPLSREDNMTLFQNFADNERSFPWRA